MRTSIVKTIGQEISMAKNRIILTMEHYMFLLLLVFGKIKVDNKLHYNIRDEHLKNLSA